MIRLNRSNWIVGIPDSSFSKILISCIVNTKLKIDYENLYYYGNSDDDSKRRLKFTITSKTFIGINIDRRLFVSQFGTGLQAGFNMIAGAIGLEQEKADVMGKQAQSPHYLVC